MLGIIILVIIGKKFYELATTYEKHKWGITILGIGSYYVGAFVFGMILAFFAILFDSNWFETANRFTLVLIELPIGLLTCYLVYIFLQKKWEKEIPEMDQEIDQIGNKD
jgi:hypothetical protein